MEKERPNLSHNSSIHIIKNERINYNNSVKISSTQLTEVFYYSREFKTFHDIKVLTVKLDIPFTGNEAVGTRSRILLYLDDHLLCDGTMYNQVNWELKPLHLEGTVVDIKPGNHKIKLMCCVNGGILHIPHVDPQSIENTIKPPISGNLLIIAQN